MTTIRKQMMHLLSENRYRAKEISQALGIPEKEVSDHLRHIALTVGRLGRKLSIEPAMCLSCEYLFRDRKRLSKPGKCPRCKGQHIREPRYHICER